MRHRTKRHGEGGGDGIIFLSRKKVQDHEPHIRPQTGMAAGWCSPYWNMAMHERILSREPACIQDTTRSEIQSGERERKPEQSRLLSIPGPQGATLHRALRNQWPSSTLATAYAHCPRTWELTVDHTDIFDRGSTGSYQ